MSAGTAANLASLVDRSLVAFDGERYQLVEPVRQYAAERLRAGATPDQIRDLHRRHRDHFLAATERWSAGWDRADQRAALDALEAERDNLRAATPPGPAASPPRQPHFSTRSASRKASA
jgi:non-specific serine/threonine protein kinase